MRLRVQSIGRKQHGLRIAGMKPYIAYVESSCSKEHGRVSQMREACRQNTTQSVWLKTVCFLAKARFKESRRPMNSNTDTNLITEVAHLNFWPYRLLSGVGGGGKEGQGGAEQKERERIVERDE